MQITCNACYTYAVPTESKLPVPVDLDFFIHLLVIVSIAAVWWPLFRYRWYLSFGTPFPTCSNVSFDARCWSFFLISTRKSIVYALLYISATLNERTFSGGGLWMKKTNLCRCNNSSEIFTISFLHHRHLRAITCTFTVKILKFGTPETIAIIVLKLVKFDVKLD